MPELRKQVWLKQLMHNYYPTSNFLNFVTDLSSLSENDKINLAAAGVDPACLINNTTYPIQILQSVDDPLELVLDLFETENTLVRYPVAVERSYNMLEGELVKHRNSLQKTTFGKAAHAYSPTANASFTPVISTTGADDGEGNKRLTIADILKFKRKFVETGLMLDDLYLALCPRHIEDLLLEDSKTFKDVFDLVDGKPKRFGGFGMLESAFFATYNRTTMQKKAYGAVAASTDGFSSFAFIKQEVMKADGKEKMYSRVDDPESRATVVGFDKRFIALPFRNKGVGAIVSAAV